MKKKIEPNNNFTSQKKTLVIELYSSFDQNNLTAHNHELIGNFEQGYNLRAFNNQSEYLIFALDKHIEEEINLNLNKRKINTTVYNLNNHQTLINLNYLFNNLDTLIIVAQGNLREEKIAGLEADAFIELLKEDLELSNIPNLELFSSKMGNASEYINELKYGLNGVVQNIISYTALLSTNEKGRLFIVASANNTQADHFYSEENINHFRKIDQVINTPNFSF